MDRDKPENRIDAAALDTLLAAHDGDVALLYLYGLRRGRYTAEQAARDLCRTLRDIDAAAEKLQRMGLSPASAPAAVPAAAPAEEPPEPLLPVEELPQYSAVEIGLRARSDPAFTAVVDEAAQMLGRKLGGNELRVLFGIYDHLGLPAEVILELLNFLGERYREKYGESRRPSARVIEKEAYLWAHREILTLDQAEDYIRSQKERHSRLGQVKSLLGLAGRELSKTQAEMIGQWLDLGFGDQALEMALDRTVTNTGGVKLPYMNKILLSWHEKGLHTPQEIQAGDSRRPAAPVKSAGGVKSSDLDELDRILKMQS